MSGLIRRRSLVAVGLLALVGSTWAAPAAATDYRFTVRLDSECPTGRGPANDELTIKLRTSSGTTIDQMTVHTDGQGDWSGCFAGGGITKSGRQNRASNGTTGRTLTIPTLTVITDRGNDTVHGKGPAGSRVRIRVLDCNTKLVGGCPQVVSRLRPTSGTGAYAADLAGTFDARGHDYVLVTFTSSAGDRVTNSGRFPEMDVSPGRAIVSGTINPGQSAAITVRDSPGGAVLYTKNVRADPYGSFGEGTTPATIVAGNQVRVSFESDARLTVPETSLTYESITHVIEVHCLPRRKLLLYWLNMQPVDGYQLTADATGLAKAGPRCGGRGSHPG